MRAIVIVLYSLLMGAAVLSSATADETLRTDADGWHSWQVDEPGASTEMCCSTWKGRAEVRHGCDLDGRTVRISDDGDCAVAAGTMQVYVLVTDGEPEDIRVLSSNCPVSSRSMITDHGLVSVDENMQWFRNIIENQQSRQDLREEALFALVLSGSDTAFHYLDSLLSQR